MARRPTLATPRIPREKRTIYTSAQTWSEVQAAAESKEMPVAEWVRLAIADALAVSE